LKWHDRKALAWFGWFGAFPVLVVPSMPLAHISLPTRDSMALDLLVMSQEEEAHVIAVLETQYF
jgi:hypothetical protein